MQVFALLVKPRGNGTDTARSDKRRACGTHETRLTQYTGIGFFAEPDLACGTAYIPLGRAVPLRSCQHGTYRVRAGWHTVFEEDVE